MCRSRVVFIATVSIMFLLSVGASGQNLLVNSDFDTDLTGWDGRAEWDPADAFGSPSSGSATWINDFTAGGAMIVRQCVELDPWIEGYDLAAQNFIPSGQPGGGHSYLAVNFYSDSECNTYTSSVYSSIFSAFDNWTLVNFTGWTPSGAVSAQVVVANQKTASGDFQTSCDAIYFARNPEMVFGDGFETTDTSGWSAVTGGVK